MKRPRYTEEQVSSALRQAESGTPVAEVIRTMGVTVPTFYRWKKQFAGMAVTVNWKRQVPLEHWLSPGRTRFPFSRPVRAMECR
jgi:hypothetical protein